MEKKFEGENLIHLAGKKKKGLFGALIFLTTSHFLWQYGNGYQNKNTESTEPRLESLEVSLRFQSE